MGLTTSRKTIKTFSWIWNSWLIPKDKAGGECNLILRRNLILLNRHLSFNNHIEHLVIRVFKGGSLGKDLEFVVILGTFWWIHSDICVCVCDHRFISKIIVSAKSKNRASPRYLKDIWETMVRPVVKNLWTQFTDWPMASFGRTLYFKCIVTV